LIVGLLLGFGGCGSEPTVLSVGSVEFSESDLLGFTSDRRTRLAEIAALGWAVAQEDLMRVGEPVIQRRRDDAILQYLTEEIKLELEGVDEAMLEARYDANPEYELTVRHLVLLAEEGDPEEKTEAARTGAEEALARLRSGEDFAEVASEVSEEPGAAERGGLLQPGRKGSWVSEFWDAAAALQIGQVSPVVQSPYGFHVLKLEGRTPVPFPEARRRVVAEVAGLLSTGNEAVQERIDSLRAPLVVDTAALTRGWEDTGTLFLLANQWARESESETPVASWPAGNLTARAFHLYLIGQDRVTWQAINDNGLEGLLRAAQHAGRRALLVAVGRDMGLEVPRDREEAIQAEWLGALGQWAAAFGFKAGMSSEEVKAASLEAVSSSAQSARIAREEVRTWAPLFLSAHPLGPS
jgi:hypothetical protein